jgi:hypothetical protein
MTARAADAAHENRNASSNRPHDMLPAIDRINHAASSAAKNKPFLVANQRHA